ncbi:hypothetical protein P1P75_01180 [Streptomyces sp. ID05-39B]|uniref:hypothetical protein n=1 Tax=Streptomyces sp. ID05-39B TaxID=3028664 RepID=UPI0029B3853C|nr:hypothetical protein [Streptomyces sp. ID05-39B]MDX3525096.1 hypothetical protein [Streptomyces sp. ID05-39B]
MKIPSNVIRCLVDNGPILYPQPGGSYKCATCGGGVGPGRGGEPGYHWEESYGYLVQVETVDDERDSDEEIEDLYSAISVFADILGDGMTAQGVGDYFTCTEAERLTKALMEGGHKRAAMTFLEGHAFADDDPDDLHADIDDYEAYVLELAGKPVPELIEEPKPKAPAGEVALPTVSVDELLHIMNLD